MAIFVQLDLLKFPPRAGTLTIARELVRALEIDGSRASSIAAAIKGVLSAESYDAAQSELDELGFAALDELLSSEAEPAVASALGGSLAQASDENETPSEQDGVEPGNESQALTGNNNGRAEQGKPWAAYSPEAETRREVSNNGEHGPGVGERATNGSNSGPGFEQQSAEGESKRGGTSPTGGTQSRLRSYVVPADASRSAFGTSPDGDEEVERAGVDAVLRYEREHGREPEEMPPMNPGFDVRSLDADGNVRVIEVKSTADAWGPRGVAMSSRQFTTAQQRREEFWLYVVDQALTAPRVHPINDPATKVEQYFFDDGWRVVSERYTGAQDVSTGRV